MSAAQTTSFTITTTVASFKYEQSVHDFTGRLGVLPIDTTTNEAGCKGERRVKLSRIKDGEVIRRGSDITASNGSFRLSFSAQQEGKFKIEVDPRTFSNQYGELLECSGATKTLTVKKPGTGGSTGPTDTAAQDIVVVTANIEEAYSAGKNDLGNHFEIDNFAQRVKRILPTAPDVVLLQEVNYKTSALTAKRLSARFGRTYIVAVRPISNTTIEYASKQVHTETAIVINKKTMAVANRGGFFEATYPSSVSVGRVSVRRHAYMLARDKRSGVKIPLVSLHYAQRSSFRTARASNEYRGKWSSQLKALLARKYNAGSSSRPAVIAGDFNAGRCYKGTFANCTVAAWWKTMAGKPTPYVEAGREHLVPYGVDAIWTRGRAVAAGWDVNGTSNESDRGDFYSHHRFRWATIEAKSGG